MQQRISNVKSARLERSGLANAGHIKAGIMFLPQLLQMAIKDVNASLSIFEPLTDSARSRRVAVLREAELAH